MISQHELKQILGYNPKTGIFTWKKRIGKSHALIGSIAGGVRTKGGYWRIAIKGKRYYAHRLAWFYMFGKWPNPLDHKDRIKTNNSIGNLREATFSQNNANRDVSKFSKIGLKGVQQRSKNSYVSRITVKGVGYVLGHFNTAEEAHATYARAAKMYFREFANPGAHRLGGVKSIKLKV